MNLIVIGGFRTFRGGLMIIDKEKIDLETEAGMLLRWIGYGQGSNARLSFRSRNFAHIQMKSTSQITHTIFSNVF